MSKTPFLFPYSYYLPFASADQRFLPTHPRCRGCLPARRCALDNGWMFFAFRWCKMCCATLCDDCSSGSDDFQKKNSSYRVHFHCLFFGAVFDKNNASKLFILPYFKHDPYYQSVFVNPKQGNPARIWACHQYHVFPPQIFVSFEQKRFLTSNRQGKGSLGLHNLKLWNKMGLICFNSSPSNFRFVGEDLFLRICTRWNIWAHLQIYNRQPLQCSIDHGGKRETMRPRTCKQHSPEGNICQVHKSCWCL